jgi:hypothetical protein
MKRALLLLLALVLPALAEDQKYSSDQWVAFYYRNPQPERFVQEVRAMSAGGYFAKESSQPPLITFLGRVMAQNPGKIEGWMSALDDLPPHDRDVLYAALWFSGTGEGRRCLEARGIKEYAGKNPPDVLTMEIDSPVVIDMLWAWYFATGDETAIRRIVFAFNLNIHDGAAERFKSSKKTAQDRRAAYQDLAFKEVQWSVADNCARHGEVKAACEKLYTGNTLDKTENLWLAVILAKVDPAKYKIKPGSTQWTENGKPVAARPNVNSAGGFGAMLFLTDNPLQPDGGKKLSASGPAPLTKVRRNVPVHTVLLFSDPGLDAAGAANVTFDTVVRKPDGSVMARTDDAICWKGKYEAPAHALQLSKGSMAIQINPGDLPGVYTVEITAHDNVRNVAVPVKTTFEVP